MNNDIKNIIGSYIHKSLISIVNEEIRISMRCVRVTLDMCDYPGLSRQIESSKYKRCRRCKSFMLSCMSIDWDQMCFSCMFYYP